MKVYSAKNNFNKDRKWKRISRKYEDEKTMRNLEEAFRASKLWRWQEDEGNCSLTKAQRNVTNTIAMWNEEIAGKRYPKVFPSKHDQEVFAFLIYKQFSPKSMKGYPNFRKML